MAETNVKKHSERKRIREPPSVPYVWEVRPGIPKKDWKPASATACPVLALPPPVRLIASVPFNWEEKPGTPLPSFLQSRQESATPPPTIVTLPLPPLHSQGSDSNRHINNVNGDSGSDGERETIFDLDLEEFVFESDESFSSAESAPSLLVNCLVPSTAIYTAIPVQETSVADDIDSQLETLSSPASETDSSTSSYATGTSSPVGATFLECLFPLLPPNSGFLEKVGRPEKGTPIPPNTSSKHLNHESNTSVNAGRLPTLGELIMMSRRRSYQRRAVQMRKQNLSMEFMKKKAFGCGLFRTTIQMIGGLQRKKCHPVLKLL